MLILSLSRPQTLGMRVAYYYIYSASSFINLSQASVHADAPGQNLNMDEAQRSALCAPIHTQALCIPFRGETAAQRPRPDFLSSGSKAQELVTSYKPSLRHASDFLRSVTKKTVQQSEVNEQKLCGNQDGCIHFAANAGCRRV